MASKRISLIEATAEQLRDFATLNLGIEVPGKANKNAILGLISSAYDKDFIEVAETDAPHDVERVAAPSREATPDKRRILIQRSEEPGGGDPVFVGVNGKGMLIERGKPQLVPLPYIEALDHAIKYVYSQDEDLDMIRREVPSYPFSYVD
jgi:hypothetical protein